MTMPFWFPKKTNVVWYLVFIGLFFLSLDFWWWEKSEPLVFGLPFWIVYLIILTIITSIAFYLFSKYYWRDDQ